MNTCIKKFSLKGLFGYKNITIDFSDPTLILIGENGYGKTTLLNALYYLLKNDYENLVKIKFEEISIILFDKEFIFKKNDIRAYCDYLKRRQEFFRDGILEFVKQNISNTDWTFLQENILEKDKRTEVFKILKTHPILQQVPPEIVFRKIFEYVEINKRFSQFDSFLQERDRLNAEILYFPTFRRIEGDLNNIFPRKDELPLRESISKNLLSKNTVIQFGMQDVEERINKVINLIKESSLFGASKVYGNTINCLINNTKPSGKIDESDYSKINIILSRLNIVEEKEKQTILSEINDENSLLYKNDVLMFFLEQLLDVFDEQNKFDSSIKQFRDVCNKYLADKQFVYDENGVSLNLYRTIGETTEFSEDSKLSLKQLSSGEKQIISIFSRIYLEPEKNFIVLFDEPELSLSIYWQEKLLPDILRSERCKFLLAVTHSPFIFNNELKSNTVGLEEFVK